MPTPEELFDKIAALSPPDRLRLAADLLEARKPKLAYSLIERVKVELGAAMALNRIETPTPRGR